MRIETLDVLRCPYCGTRPSLVSGPALVRTAGEIESGVLGCECCAFPIVAGIPVMVADAATRSAMHALEAGNGQRALFTLLGIDGDAGRAAAFAALLAAGTPTYREAVGILSPDAEGQYFIYRFTDPTFLLARAVLAALAGDPHVRQRRTLDLCGGSGHLTRALGDLTAPDRTIVADLHFWKLWLARRVIAPGSDAICCDANHPLPFARGTFSLVVCSDAFPYLWHKRLVAEEMMRLAGEDGVVVLPHLHSALGENLSSGMTLTPRAYAALFEPLGPRLFRESVLGAHVLDGVPLDLAHDEVPEALEGEPAMTLIATRLDALFRVYPRVDAPASVSGTLMVNPLYRVERRGESSVLTLQFPTPEYEEEFAACKQYLPASLTVPVDLTAPIDASALGSRYAELRRRHVIIDAPPNF